MRSYVINLTRRPDRMAAMTRALQGLEFRRIEAIDAQNTPQAALRAHFDDRGPLGEIPSGDKCCTLSHRLAWQAFLQSGDSHAAILEDDVVLSPSAGQFLGKSGWLGPGVDLVKLEHYGPAGQSVLLSDLREVAKGFQIGRMHSRHTGAAAYVLSRRAAALLVYVARFTLPVDHLLFNPNNSPLFSQLGPWQLLPAVARQRDFVGARSDIEGWRLGLRKLTPTYVRRELIRFGYDLRLLPRQLLLAASGRASFMRIETEAPGGYPVNPAPPDC